MVRPDVDFADPTMVPDPSFGVDPIIQEKVDLTPALLDSIPGVVSGKTPNEKASEVGNFLRSIPVAEEFTGTGSSSEGVDIGIPVPNPDRPTIDVTVPDQVQQEPTIEDALSLPEGFRLGDGTTTEGALSFGELLKSSTDKDDTSTNPAGNKTTGGQKASATSSVSGGFELILKDLNE